MTKHFKSLHEETMVESESNLSHYTVLKGISYLSDDKCENGHFNIIPACTKIKEDNKLYCLDCGVLIFRVAKIRRIEFEI